MTNSGAYGDAKAELVPCQLIRACLVNNSLRMMVSSADCVLCAEKLFK